MATVETLRWRDGALELLDQRELPRLLNYVVCRSAADTAAAIRAMVVRGAPAIGCAAAYGVALEARNLATVRTAAGAVAGGNATARNAAAGNVPVETAAAGLEDALQILRSSRPTAVNLFWALDRMQRALRESGLPTAAPALAERLLAEAHAIFDEDIQANRAMGRHGAALLPPSVTVMTHCNAGALATAGHGTALGIVRSARDSGKDVRVVANETRPYLQGARLTAWEMQQENIPVTLAVDAAAGHLMQRGGVDVVVVGADRIAANGDVANKIGTYPLAVLAQRHGIPFYVAAPLATIDAATPTGAAIPIEERSADEVFGYRDLRWAPERIAAANPAFDVTPHELVTAIVTEQGVVRPPFREGIAAMLARTLP